MRAVVLGVGGSGEDIAAKEAEFPVGQEGVAATGAYLLNSSFHRREYYRFRTHL
jgi:hypothetical protein